MSNNVILLDKITVSAWHINCLRDKLNNELFYQKNQKRHKHTPWKGEHIVGYNMISKCQEKNKTS